MRFLVLCAVSLMASAVRVPAQQNFGSHPYMGWSSWSLIRGHPTEQNIKAQADALLANHLDAAGYRYVNVDDGWTDGWDDHGIPKAKAAAFPQGMAEMARYMHAHGLLFGIYLNPGIRDTLLKQNPQIAGSSAHIADIVDTSQPGSTRNGSYRIDFSKPAAVAYIRSQVAQFDAWGVDFIKMDFVGPGGGREASDNREEMRQWHLALSQASHPIWLELSNYLSIDQAALWRGTANGWRIENDIECYGACDKSSDPAIKGNLTIWTKVVTRFADVAQWTAWAGPGTTASPAAGWAKAAGGGWNDLDTMELGNGDKDGINPVERQTMLSLWAISCAPLYLGSDLTKMDAADLKLITNKELIGIDQAGVPARTLDIQHLRGKQQQAWMTTYADGSAVLAVFNLDAAPASVKLSWQEVDALRDTSFAGRAFTLHDVVSGAEKRAVPEGLSVDLPAHGSEVFRIPAR